MKKINIILILCLSLFIYGCSKYDINKENFNKDTNLIPVENVDFINENNNIVIYFGRPTCPNCEEFLPTLEGTLKSMNKNIYYFNTDEWRNNENFEDVLNKYMINQIPSIVRIKYDGSFKKLDILEESSNLEDKKSIEKKLNDFIK